MGSSGNRRKEFAVAVSLGLHALVLGMLGVMAVTTLPFTPVLNPPLFVELEPRPLLQGEVARRSTTAASLDQNDPSRLSASHSSPARPTPLQLPGDRQLPPDQGSGLATDQPTGSSGRSWQVGPDIGLAGRVAESLRTSVLGCEYPERLSPEERQICDDRTGERSGRALERVPRITGTGNAERDARFEAQGRERLRDYERRRSQPPVSERGNVGVQDGPGSNFGMGVAGRHLDPSLQPDHSGPIQTRRRDGRPEDRIPRTPPNR